MIPTVMCLECCSCFITASLWYVRLFFLFEQSHISDSHLLVYRFAHVVNSEQGDGHADQGFHLDPRLRNCLRSAVHFRAILRNYDVYAYLGERQSVAKRNQLRSFLGGLNPGNARGREDIAFGDLIFCDQIESSSSQPNFAASNGSSFTEGLRRNINHLSPTITADVSEFLHLVTLSF